MMRAIQTKFYIPLQFIRNLSKKQYRAGFNTHALLKNKRVIPQRMTNLSLNGMEIKNFSASNNIDHVCKIKQDKMSIPSAKYSTESPSSPYWRHYYHKDVEHGVNEQILAEMTASIVYLSMACFFGRSDIALPGFQTFFMYMHKEEHHHAMTFINYQNMRGGNVKFCPISVPECQDFGCILKALQLSVELEKEVKEKLMCLNSIAEKHHDHHLTDIITTIFIPEQDHSICEMARLVTRATKMCKTSTGEYLFDKIVYDIFCKKLKDFQCNANEPQEYI